MNIEYLNIPSKKTINYKKIIFNDIALINIYSEHWNINNHYKFPKNIRKNILEIMLIQKKSNLKIIKDILFIILNISFNISFYNYNSSIKLITKKDNEGNIFNCLINKVFYQKFEN